MEKWRGQVKTALDFFSRMKLYSVAAKQSKDVVSKLLDAAKTAAEAADAHRRQQEALMKVMAQRGRQQREQRQQQQQHVTSHPHHLNGLMTQNIKTDHLQSPHSSPMSARSGDMSPVNFGGMPMTMGGGMVAGTTGLQVQMGTVTQMPSGPEFMGFSSGETANTGPGMASIASSMPTAGGRVATSVPQNAVPSGFWDDMMWDLPEMESPETDFGTGAMNGGFDGTWTGSGPTQPNAHGQWGFGTG
jgi:hypothetical protein